MALVILLCWAGRAAQPNVLFILVDDMGWADPACFGGEVATPNIDRLAKEGIQFRQFYVASPICSPSRCGLITGQFPARWNLSSYLQTRAGNRECEQADFLDPKAPSLPRAFQQAGYATAHIGKWHLGGGRDVTDAPKFAAYGYDVGLGTYESPEPAAGLGLKSVPWATNREPQQVPRHERTRWMVDEVIQFLKQHRKQPCFVNLWLDDVHTPFRPKEGGDERDLPKRFREVLTETDRQIGRLLEGVRELGVGANTIIVFAGDNGPEPSFGGARTGGLRGMKWSLYEGGLRTPLIAHWPGVIPAGTVNDTTIVGAVDLFPTLCALANVPTPTSAVFDGENLAAAFHGEKVVRTRPLFWEYGRKTAPPGTKGLRAFPYPTEPQSKSPNVAIRDGKWKFLINADGSEAELYDLAADPKESKNLAGSESATVTHLRHAALDWRASLPKMSVATP